MNALLVAQNMFNKVTKNNIKLQRPHKLLAFFLRLTLQI